jgi:hypothetical protein
MNDFPFEEKAPIKANILPPPLVKRGGVDSITV